MISVPSRESIIDTAQMTWSNRENITLDEVDGTFYWGVCREDLTSKWQTQRKLTDADGSMSSDQRWHFFNLLHEIEKESPGASLWPSRQWFGMRTPISLNTGSALADLEIPTFDVGRRKVGGMSGWILVGVMNSRWAGEDVECEVRKVAQKRPGWLDQWLNQADEGHDNEALSMVSFHFYESNSLRYQSRLVTRYQLVTVESPVIMCSVRLPLPPEGTIAAIYDATVIGKHKWNTRLYGYRTGHNQTVDVAIRTWMIGLLVGIGVKFVEAQREAESLLKSMIAQPGFNNDRSALVKRVPESAAYLFQKPRRNT